MTSERQLAANRHNAKSSTGPRTLAGKMRSRRNALVHGLAAETVVDVFEDIEEYRSFEDALVRDIAPANAIERQLTFRLASLLWRLSRATAIESGLLSIQQSQKPASHAQGMATLYNLLNGPNAQNARRNTSLCPSALAFTRLSNFNSATFDRLQRYETSLWRQVAQTAVILGIARSQRPSADSR